MKKKRNRVRDNPDTSADPWHDYLRACDRQVRSCTRVCIWLHCFAGVFDLTTREELLSIVTNKKLTGSKKVKQLVKKANDNGGRDNITAILIEI